MATYVVLANFTDQGIRNVNDTVKRLDAFREMAKSKGITVKDAYYTLGKYDVLVTVDAPDEMSATALSLAVAKLGNIRNQTMRAFTPAEMTTILGKV